MKCGVAWAGVWIGVASAILAGGNGGFEDPVPLREIDTPAHEKGPFLSADGLRLYFHRQKGRRDSDTAASTVWCAVRDSLDASFGEPIKVFDDAGDPTLTPDELTLVFVRLADGPLGPNLDLFTATRPSRESAFGSAKPIVELNTRWNEVGPKVTRDGRALYFASDRPAGLGGYDIWIAERTTEQGGYGTAHDVEELNSASEEANPELASDGLSIFFASDRPGGLGRCDLYVATRGARADRFASPRNLHTLNSPMSDKAPTLSGDGRFLVFRSSRKGGAGLSDLYLARQKNDPTPPGNR